MIYAADVVVI